MSVVECGVIRVGKIFLATKTMPAAAVVAYGRAWIFSVKYLSTSSLLDKLCPCRVYRYGFVFTGAHSTPLTALIW